MLSTTEVYASSPSGDYLTFTANTAGSTVRFRWSIGSTVMYRYDINGTSADWATYTKGKTITLTNVDDWVQFKGTNISTDSSYHFLMTGSIAGSGDVTSLTNGVGGDVTLASSCYANMFNGCTSLTTAPVLPSTTLTEECYSRMFIGCTALTTAPELPATTLASGCYSSMLYGTNVLPDLSNIDFTSTIIVQSGGLQGLFAGTKITDAQLKEILPTNPQTGNAYLPVTTLAQSCYYQMFSACKSLTTAPELPATTLASYCYQSMFQSCTSLTTAPSLPATTLADHCYQSMFSVCTSLTTAPSLPATTLASYCYISMFYGCTSLTTAPELPVTTLADHCYVSMFQGCTSLTTAPELPATTLADYCYQSMFNGCTSLTSAPALSGSLSGNSCCISMFSGCKSLTVPADMSNVTSLSGDYCCQSMYYGTSIGLTDVQPTNYICTWKIPSVSTSSSWNENMFEGYSVTTNKMYYVYNLIPLTFTANTAGSTVTFNYYSGSNVQYTTDGTTWTNCASALSSSPTTITLTNVGDWVQFSGTNVTTNLSYHFSMTGSIAGSGDVTSLTNGAGGAATLSSSCYHYMFNGCTSLTTAPSLPATNLADYCYYYMFYGCTSLKAPADMSKVTTLAEKCCYYMYYGCTGIKLSTSTSSDKIYKKWITPNVTSVSGWNSGMFTNTGGSFKSDPSLNTTYYVEVELQGYFSLEDADDYVFGSGTAIGKLQPQSADDAVASEIWNELKNSTIYIP